jgi:two-component system chemotaxis sensor kinase CheA
VDELEQFKQTFFEECDELLQQLEEVATTLVAGPNDSEGLDAMFRSVHSIKAGAGAFKFERLVRFSHEFENVMDQVRGGDLQLGDGDPAILVHAGDILQDLVFAARSGEEATEGMEDDCLSDLRTMGGSTGSDSAGANAASEASGGDYLIVFKPHRSLFESANEPQLLIRALQDLGTLKIEVDKSEITDLASMDPGGAYLSWTFELTGVDSEDSIREIFEFVEDDCTLEIEAVRLDAPEDEGESLSEPVAAMQAAMAKGDAAPSSTVQTTSIRVDLDRVDRLVDMVGELVIAQAMALESMHQLVDSRHIHQLQALEDLTMRTRQLQEGVMAVRMQPLKAVFSRFPRVVRDLSAKLGKQVRIELEGEGTEVDKTIIEELSDPLTHMIRNCMDHGLESPVERLAAGKPEEGLVRLSAEHRNGRILIRVSDNGRGLNLEKVKAKAIENGVISDDAELSKEEIEALIFMPGFSTADSISDVSGRGVGMDVVRRNIQKLGGRVTVESTEGKGSTFTLALPLTLAVLDGMLVDSCSERYVVPLSTIMETVCPDKKDMRDTPDGGTIMKIRGEVIRLIDVSKVLGVSRKGQPEPLRKLVMIVETEFGRRIGLVVDELLGQQQVVIKSLEANFKSIPGVAGTAILGDGRVRLILDVDGLAAMAPISINDSEIVNTEDDSAGADGSSDEAVTDQPAAREA